MEAATQPMEAWKLCACIPWHGEMDVEPVIVMTSTSTIAGLTRHMAFKRQAFLAELNVQKSG